MFDQELDRISALQCCRELQDIALRPPPTKCVADAAVSVDNRDFESEDEVEGKGGDEDEEEKEEEEEEGEEEEEVEVRHRIS